MRYRTYTENDPPAPARDWCEAAEHTYTCELASGVGWRVAWSRAETVHQERMVERATRFFDLA